MKAGEGSDPGDDEAPTGVFVRPSATLSDAQDIARYHLRAMPAVLTSREVAQILRVGVREVRLLVASGQLAGARVGPRKVIRISKLAVLALLKVRDAA